MTETEILHRKVVKNLAHQNKTRYNLGDKEMEGVTEFNQLLRKSKSELIPIQAAWLLLKISTG
jgi:hypothetical protein